MLPEDPQFPHEEYALLIGATAPGSARKLYRRSTASTSKSSMDIALADMMCDARPSGVVLPKILRRKLQVMNKFKVDEVKEAIANNTDKDKNNDSKDEVEARRKEAEATKNHLAQSLRSLEDMSKVSLFDRVSHFDAKRLHSKSPIALIQSNYDQVLENISDDVKAHLPKYYGTPHSYRNIDRSRVFTTTKLEKKISKAHAALIDIQKQLQRGEEIYFQDTDVHGNIYKGWEAFIDAKPEHIGIQAVDSVPYDKITALGPSTSSSAPTRKIHMDSRWFSSSTFSVDNGSIRKYDRRKTKKASGSSSKPSSPMHPSHRLASTGIRRSPAPNHVSSSSATNQELSKPIRTAETAYVPSIPAPESIPALIPSAPIPATPTLKTVTSNKTITVNGSSSSAEENAIKSTKAQSTARIKSQSPDRAGDTKIKYTPLKIPTGGISTELLSSDTSTNVRNNIATSDNVERQHSQASNDAKVIEDSERENIATEESKTKLKVEQDSEGKTLLDDSSSVKIGKDSVSEEKTETKDLNSKKNKKCTKRNREELEEGSRSEHPVDDEGDVEGDEDLRSSTRLRKKRK